MSDLVTLAAFKSPWQSSLRMFANFRLFVGDVWPKQQLAWFVCFTLNKLGICLQPLGSCYYQNITMIPIEGRFKRQ